MAGEAAAVQDAAGPPKQWRRFFCPPRTEGFRRVWYVYGSGKSLRTIGCGPHWPMMILTYALIVGPSAYYFYRTFPIATMLEQGLALVLLPSLFVAFTLTACSDPGVVRMGEAPGPEAGLPRELLSGGSADAALEGVTASGMDFSSSGMDADGLVDEDTAAQRRAAHGSAVPDDSAGYGFRKTVFEQEVAQGRSTTIGQPSARGKTRRGGVRRRLRPGQPLPRHHPDIPEHSEFCPDCGVTVAGPDHHCPWTGQCIAEGNVIPFYFFLVLVFVDLIFVMISSFAHTVRPVGVGGGRLRGIPSLAGVRATLSVGLPGNASPPSA